VYTKENYPIFERDFQLLGRRSYNMELINYIYLYF